VSLRIAIARSPYATPLLTLGWRLGLGPILGRRLCLITAAGDGDVVHRQVLPYIFIAGDFVVPSIGNPSWAEAAARRPQVTVQAHPGPLATRARPLTDDEQRRLGDLVAASAPDLSVVPHGVWRVLEPTGDPGPSPALADLNWLWVVAVAGLVVWRRLRQSW
jgi:hypothetical protein